jgi:hypothetical protein
MLAFQDGELMAEGKILQHQAAMSTKGPKDGSKPQANQVDHSGKVTQVDRLLVLMLLISKPDGLVTRDSQHGGTDLLSAHPQRHKLVAGGCRFAHSSTGQSG